MDFDACLEQPVFITLYQDGCLKLLIVEPSSRSWHSFFSLLRLLIIARALLGALHADASEEADEVILSEVESQAHAALDEIFFLYRSKSLRIKNLVGFLN